MDITTVSTISLSVIFLSTVAGSSLVFLFRNGMGKRTSSAAMGFAGGVMIAASFFGLIMPSVESAGSIVDMIPSAIGFLLGGALMWLLDITVPHIHGYSGTEEGAASTSPLLLAFAAGAMIYITLDEIIPEARKEGLEHIGM